MKRVSTILGLGCALLWSGCFDVRQSLRLESDLSGTATVLMTLDMEPMVYMAAQMGRAFEGKEGPPTEEELAKARQEFEENQKSEQVKEFEQQRADLEAGLPEGVRLLDAQVREEGTSMGIEMTFEFDHVALLKEIKPGGGGEEAEGEDGGEGGPGGSDSPFGDLVVEETDDTIRIATPPMNPAADGMGPMDMDEEDPDMAPMVEAIKRMRVVFELSTPLEVVEHNATRVDGERLVWDYDFEALTALAEAGAEAGVMSVTLKK